MFSQLQQEFDEFAYECRVQEIADEIYCLLLANLQRINGQKRALESCDKHGDANRRQT
jgi:hypothetical protein